MWKRKTEEDFIKEKEGKLFGLSKSDFLLSFFISFSLAIYLYVHDPNISRLIVYFVIIFILCCIGVRLFDDPVGILNIFTAGSTLAPSVICNVCHSIVSRSKKEKCECSGKYEPLDDWKWIEDEIEESEQTN